VDPDAGTRIEVRRPGPGQARYLGHPGGTWRGAAGAARDPGGGARPEPAGFPPARTLARLVEGQLRAAPAILGQWDCQLGWCTAWPKDFDTARLTFTHPASRASCKEPFVQFGMMIDVAGQDPQSLARQIIEAIRDTDPKSTADMIGGSKENAEKLGLNHREPTRWRHTAG
jgi:hypothetical protein